MPTVAGSSFCSHITSSRRFDAQGVICLSSQVLELDDEFEAVDEEEDQQLTQCVGRRAKASPGESGRKLSPLSEGNGL